MTSLLVKSNVFCINMFVVLSRSFPYLFLLFKDLFLNMLIVQRMVDVFLVNMFIVQSIFFSSLTFLLFKVYIRVFHME